MGRGEWKNGMKNGVGWSFLRKGGFYKGYYKNGKRDGEGNIYDEKGKKEQKLVFKEGRRNGFTVLENLKYGKRKGHVFYWSSNSDRYEGQFKNNVPYGKGKVLRGNGDKIVGEFKNGQLNGFGKYFWKDGDYFEGQFKNGVRHGEGEFYISRDKKFEVLHSLQSSFLNGLPEGLGILFLRNGLRFLVDFEHGFVR